jgi:hypothetical protein
LRLRLRLSLKSGVFEKFFLNLDLDLNLNLSGV